MDRVSAPPPHPVLSPATGSRLERLTRLVTGPWALPRWAVASLAVNVLIIVTGALVRLTASGLGCPTWPRCTEDSYVSHPALGIHGAIEFGNRLLTFVLVVVAVLTWVAAMLVRDTRPPTAGRRRRDLRWIAGGMALGIPAQAVIGGITVLTRLNPFVVALHLMVSMVLVALAVWLVRRSWGVPAAPSGRPAVLAVRAAFVLTWLTLWLGTVVTGSGPHAGDLSARRTGFDPVLVTHLHSAAVFALVAATLAAVLLLRRRAAVLLLAVQLGQGAVGVAQYHLGLPIGLVLLHLLGAALAVAAATHLLLSVRRTPAAPGSAPGRTADAEPGVLTG